MKNKSLLILLGICICGVATLSQSNRLDVEDDSQNLQLYYVQDAQERGTDF